MNSGLQSGKPLCITEIASNDYVYAVRRDWAIPAATEKHHGIASSEYNIVYLRHCWK